MSYQILKIVITDEKNQEKVYYEELKSFTDYRKIVEKIKEERYYEKFESIGFYSKIYFKKVQFKLIKIKVSFGEIIKEEEHLKTIKNISNKIVMY